MINERNKQNEERQTRGYHLDKMAREETSEKETFELRPEGL